MDYIKSSTAEMKEAAAQCEGSAGDTDQMRSNVQLEEVKCDVCGQKEY